MLLWRYGLTEVTTDTTEHNDRPVAVMSLVKGGWVWGKPPPQIIVINFFLSPPNTPFLLLVPIIDYAVIITNCCTTASKLCLTFVTNIFFSQLCVGCVIGLLKSGSRLKRMSVGGVGGDFSETLWQYLPLQKIYSCLQDARPLVVCARTRPPKCAQPQIRL